MKSTMLQPGVTMRWRAAMAASVVIASVVGSAVSAYAQPNDPMSSASQPPSTAIHRVAHGVNVLDGELLGTGPDYRALFLEDGLRFTPALGREATRNYPWTYRFEAMQRGPEESYGDVPAVRLVEDDSVRFVRHDQGIALEERFDVRQDGIELSYVLHRRPVGAGDLRIRGFVETDLTARHDSSGLRFEHGSLGGVSIGQVVAYDATGRQAAGRVAMDGDRLELIVPGAFLDRAAYPVVVDPLIGSLLNVGVGFDDINADVAYDATNDIYLVVWQREFSGSDIDIRFQRVTGTGVLVGSVGALTTTAININPTVANVNLRDRFLVCWQTGESVFGPWDIEGRSVTANLGTTSAAVTIAATAALETDPDASGDSTTSDDEALVVWDEESTLRMALVTLPSSGDPFVASTVALSSTSQDRKPAISKSGGAAGRHLIAWERDFGGSQGVEIRAALYDRNGVVLDSFQAITSTPGLDESEVDVDGDGGQWMVVFQRPESAGSSDHDIYCVGLSWDVGGAQLVSGAESPVEADASDDEIQPAIGWLGDRYGVTWTDESIAPFNYALSYKAFAALSCAPCGSELSIVGTSAFHAGSEIASERSAGGAGDTALVVFHSANNVPPFDGDVNAQLVEAIGAGGTVATVGGGCGVKGSFGAVGASAIGNANFALQFTGGDAMAPVAILNLNLATTPIPCAGCQITPIQFLLSLPMVGGNVTVPLPIPCETTFLGLNIETQLIMQNTALTGCYQIGVGVSFSDRLRFVIGQ